MVDLNEVRPTLNIPERACDALSGSDFAATVLNVVGEPRESAILGELLAGNVPSFMRTLCPVTVEVGGLRATYWVTPDYLCIGSDDDYVRVPMTPGTAQRIADAFGAYLPTRRMVNSIFSQADVKLVAKPQGASKSMRSTQVFLNINKQIEEQLSVLSSPLGSLVAGHKKDVVICKGLWLNKEGHKWGPEHIPCVAIYGWAQVIHNGVWVVWQGLNSSSHDTSYEDYSHGVRLVSAVVLVDGVAYDFAEILVTSTWATFLSDEGMLPSARYPGV